MVGERMKNITSYINSCQSTQKMYPGLARRSIRRSLLTNESRIEETDEDDNEGNVPSDHTDQMEAT